MIKEADKANFKKISIHDLKVGMFIVNLGRSWIQHPFFRNQLTIDSPKKIEKLKKYGIQEVYIDPQRGLDVPSPRGAEKVPAPESRGLNPPPGGSAVRMEEPQPPALHPSFPPLRGAGISPIQATGYVPSIEVLAPNPIKGQPMGEEGTDAYPESPEKSDSVAFWEENIGPGGEGLFSPESPLRVPFDDEIPFIQEIHAARRVKEEAEKVVRNVMTAVRMGKSIEGDRVKRAVHSMVDSILRNHDALTSLTRMKSYDEYMFVHSLDVCILSLSMARHLSLPREEMVEIGIGALLHDVGKMKIDPQILKKPATLSETEWVQVRKHPIYSLEMMEESKGIPEQAKQLALQHHERFNGNGYPFGLKGEAISLSGQIAGIVDFYDAVTTDRPFQKAVQPHEAIRKIYERGMEEFNRLLMERFIQCIGIYPFGTLVLLDTEEMGIICGVKPNMLLRPDVLIIHRDSKTPYPQPFLADLTEKTAQSSWYKRSIVMPLDPQRWNIRTEDYLRDLNRTLRGSVPAV
ncbi:MAG: HD-GYP domain-containing protein [Syntrophaceae bacterium]|nr:HD-GYP domain-containing protein [Syntrophaceae bacterium]